MQNAVEERARVAVELALAAGAFTLGYFRKAIEVTVKTDGSPVTIADQGAERLIRERVAARFPHDGVLGEEFGRSAGTSGFEWVLDPIDGTMSFVRGVPLYGTLAAVLREGRPVAGVIHMPALEETVYAWEGGGCWHEVGAAEAVRCRASGAGSLRESVVAMTDPILFEQRRPGSLAALTGACKAMRGWSDCYAHLLVATGRVEAAVEPIVSVWDVAPMAVIMREAGGAFFDWGGGERLDAGHAASACAGVAGELRAILGRFV